MPNAQTERTQNDADFEIIEGELKEYTGTSAEVIIPPTVRVIGDEAFKDCAELISVQIPSSVSAIGESSFSGCSQLTEVVLPANIKFIDNNAFSGCASLIEIRIPEQVEYLGLNAFDSCSSLTTAVVDAQDPEISAGILCSFGNCDALHSVGIAVVPEAFRLIDPSTISDELLIESSNGSLTIAEIKSADKLLDQKELSQKAATERPTSGFMSPRPKLTAKELLGGAKGVLIFTVPIFVIAVAITVLGMSGALD